MKKILIVDKLNAAIEKKKSMLSRSDFTILTATSGEEAVRIHREEKADLILTELEMPVMSGDALCSRVRSDPELKKVSVIIICSNGESDIRRCQACGANAYVAKPVNPNELFQKVGELLNVPARLSMRLLIKVSVKGKFKGDPFFSSSKNISATGILLETDKTLEKGDSITCSYFLGADQVESDGEVVRVVRRAQGRNDYGVKFTGMDASSKAKIEQYVKKLLKR
jgi:two-component system chemotaxis response regulator CheY